ncbi:MAG: PPC domain-containing DNA-binding protein [Promethearchaeota archaeon]
MKSKGAKVSRVIVGKVEPDEDLIDVITKLVKAYNVKAGFLSCIGAFKKFTIGYFNLDEKKYKLQTFDENVELVSCLGNIAYKDGEPIIHAHVSVGRPDYSIIGGHLNQPSIISVTGEIYIFEIDQQLYRSLDSQFNLSLLNI